MGIEKIQSWQSKLWGYWDVISSMGGKKRLSMQERVSQKLKAYQEGIAKVGKMLVDTRRTRFIAVCIAEYLSISETQRLLDELEKSKVMAEHVVVNQLVTDYLTTSDIEDLQKIFLEKNIPTNLGKKTLNACRLTTSRRQIQEKYLKMLEDYCDLKKQKIIQVPLLSSEVTGPEAILDFSRYLTSFSSEKMEILNREDCSRGLGPLYNNNNNSQELSNNTLVELSIGDCVEIYELQKCSQYNEYQGKVISIKENRYGIELIFNGEKKQLSLKRENLKFLQKSSGSSIPDSKKQKTDDFVEEAAKKYKALLESDPELKEMLDKDPKLAAAALDCSENPMNALKYFGKPEYSVFINKAMQKITNVHKSDNVGG